MIIKYTDLEKLQGETTVYATGTFDLLHNGHVLFMDLIKSACPEARLVIGVSPDKRVKRKKGDNRPILSQKERLAMVDAIKYVDYTFIYPVKNFGQENPVLDVVKALRPKYLISHPLNADQCRKELERYGVEIVIIPPNGRQSTTSLIKRILNSYSDEPYLV